MPLRATERPDHCAEDVWDLFTRDEYLRERTLSARKLSKVRFKAGNLDELVVSSHDFLPLRLRLWPLLTADERSGSDEDILRLILPVFMIRDGLPDSEALAKRYPDICASCAHDIADRLDTILREVTIEAGDFYRTDFYAGALALAYDALRARNAPSEISTSLMAA